MPKKIIVTSTVNQTYEVVFDPTNPTGYKTLGSGGQGTVYVAKRQSDGKQFALKLFHKKTPPKFNENIKELVQTPCPHPAFVWPLEFIASAPNGGIGYIMEIYDSAFRKFDDFVVHGTAKVKSRRVQLNALIELYSAFAKLHAIGRCFQDINNGAIVIDPEKGRVRICDCENVIPNGEKMPVMYDDNGREQYMKGVSRFIAPEIELGVKNPDVYTDRYSLAIMLFMLLTNGHPLEGSKRFKYNKEQIVTADVEHDIFGRNPIFIFSSANKTNPPDPEADRGPIAAWPMIPETVKVLFEKTFSAGAPINGSTSNLNNREQRPTEDQWKKELEKWADMLVPCSGCKKSFVAKINAKEKRADTVCPICKKDNKYNFPLMGVFNGGIQTRIVLLSPNKKVPSETIFADSSLEPVMHIIPSKKEPGTYGAVNLSNNEWMCTVGQQGTRVSPGKVIKLIDGMTIEIDYETKCKILVPKKG